MDIFFKNQLPPSVISLVDRIENFAGREIEVCVDTRPVSETDPNPDRPATEVTENTAKIFIRSRERFPPHGVLHELLHIERFWCDGIPQVLPLNDPDGERIQLTSSIENTLEHQVIVPKEESYGFEPYSYWNATERHLWGLYPWPNMTNAWARRKNLLFGWLTVSRLVTDLAVREHVEQCLRNEKAFDEAQKFAAKISEVIDSKPRAISAALRFLKIPIHEVELVKFDVIAGRRIRIPIPKH